MAAPFICKECGAPRQYINQYCPNCESIGPHIPASADHKDKNNRAGATAAKRHSPHINTYEDVSEYTRPRKEKIRTVKEPKPEKIRPPKVVKRIELDEYTEGAGERKPFSIPVPGRAALYGTFFVVLAVLIALLVINNGNSGEPSKNNTQSSAGTNASSANTSSSASPGTPATIPANNGTKPAVVTPSTPKDTAIPKLVGKPELIPTDTSVTLAWKTDERSKSILKYGTAKTTDFLGPDEPDFKIEHSTYIADLAPDTLYYYQIISTDEATPPNSGVLVADSFRTQLRSDAAPYVGSRAPDFSLRTLDGTVVSLNQYRGKKVILNFWASWCSPCKIELPHLQEIWAKYKNSSDVTVLTVAGSESIEADIVSYIAAKGYTFPVCLDVTESTFNRYDLTSIPKTFFIDKNGIIKKVQLGMFTSPGEIEFMLTSY
jgi:peroxiredoxin